MTAEEVTNLIATARRFQSDGVMPDVNEPVWKLVKSLADALERSTAETRALQAAAWDEGYHYIALGPGKTLSDNPYRPVSSVVAEDPKPLGPWKSDRGLISSPVETSVTPNYRPVADSDERPPTCEQCGAPFVWCKCEGNAQGRETLENALADVGLPVDQIMELVDQYHGGVTPKAGA